MLQWLLTFSPPRTPFILIIFPTNPHIFKKLFLLKTLILLTNTFFLKKKKKKKVGGEYLTMAVCKDV